MIISMCATLYACTFWTLAVYWFISLTMLANICCGKTTFKTIYHSTTVPRLNLNIWIFAMWGLKLRNLDKMAFEVQKKLLREKTIIELKGLAQAKIIKKSVILFWLHYMTIWCKHVHRLELQQFFNFSSAHSPVRLDIETKFLISNYWQPCQKIEIREFRLYI